ncbi:response regulator [Bradyrhizobium manausense]|uniref:response regulator n=1 Tax=Bradyrhizobium TaxID=374 RepID=UPI001BAC4869|nr:MULTISPECIES: response regulator [Bradyrhizobium]MBR0830503.1 response regulator [Bradyrhizobium manausense]UVO28265.1 response regulator [Bradyrhizobium arachidis]
MGQARPSRATALIVEDDSMQRAMLSLLLEESGYRVIACERAEDARAVLEETTTPGLCLLMTDVQLAGSMTGVELAYVAKARNPRLDVVVTSGRPLTQPLPDGAKFWAKPWAPLDVLREAEIAQLS